jgi:hypothetical protein
MALVSEGPLVVRGLFKSRFIFWISYWRIHYHSDASNKDHIPTEIAPQSINHCPSSKRASLDGCDCGFFFFGGGGGEVFGGGGPTIRTSVGIL